MPLPEGAIATPLAQFSPPKLQFSHAIDAFCLSTSSTKYLLTGDTHVCRVWFAGDGTEYTAKLKGALEVRSCIARDDTTVSMLIVSSVCARALSVMNCGRR